MHLGLPGCTNPERPFVARAARGDASDRLSRLPGGPYLNASNYFTPLFASDSIGNPATSNYSLTGATPEQLRSWGYEVTEVPGVDDRINSCLGQIGQAQLRCWGDLDQYLMEAVVPWIPYQSDAHVQVVPSRIIRYSYDQFADLPALDQIALQG